MIHEHIQQVINNILFDADMVRLLSSNYEYYPQQYVSPVYTNSCVGFSTQVSVSTLLSSLASVEASMAAENQNITTGN